MAGSYEPYQGDFVLFCFVFPPKGDGDLLEELQQRTDLIKSTLKKIAQAVV